MDACVELLALASNNGRPFKLMEDSGFRMIIDPIIAGLSNSFAINSEKVHDRVLLVSFKTRQAIREETKGKMVSVKMGCATRLNRSIYGINLQYIK
jgi:bifunctional polynucleotide phosphatase/kinase